MKISNVLAVSALGLTVAPAIADDVSEYRTVHPAYSLYRQWVDQANHFIVQFNPKTQSAEHMSCLNRMNLKKTIRLLQTAATDGVVMAMRAVLLSKPTQSNR